MTAVRYTAADVRKALRARYSAPEWATFFEVANGTGGHGRNYADAVAMNLFPSRGLRLHGFEIKVSRSDWLHELKQPHKSDAVQRYCDHWWIVTPADIVKEGELPPTWGHLILKGNGLNCVAKAPQLDKAPIEPAFLAALLRRAHEGMARGIHDGINAAMAGERAAIKGEVDRRVASEVVARTSQAEMVSKQLDIIKEKAGIGGEDTGKLYRYFDAAGFGRAVGYVHKVGVFASYGSISGLAAAARRFLGEIEGAEELLAAAKDEEAA